VRISDGHITFSLVVGAIASVAALTVISLIFSVSLRNVSQDLNGDFYMLVKRVMFIALLSIVHLITNKKTRIVSYNDILVVVLLICLTVIYFVVGGEASMTKIRTTYVFFLLYLSLRILLAQDRVFFGWVLLFVFLFFGLPQ